MAEKKSLALAIEKARHLSLLHPDTTYYVMDMYKKHAFVTDKEWIYKECILEYWMCECKFRNGVKI